MNPADPLSTSAWVSDHLGVRLLAGPALMARPGLTVHDLAGLAVRRNPRRAHLVVSRVLGKHVPVDPRIVYGAGRLLGQRVAAALGAETGDIGLTGALIRTLRDGSETWPVELAVEGLEAARLELPPLVLGYAETATGLGQVVADSFAGADYLHSTRRRTPGTAPIGRFAEVHSHATEHLLAPMDPNWLDSEAPVVLVDDELTSGRTAEATIRALHAIRPRVRYLVATLLDLRSDAHRDSLDVVASELGTRIDVVALAEGQVLLPPEVLERGRKLVAELEPAGQPGSPGRPDPTLPEPRRTDLAPVEWINARWPAGLPEGGRHGFAARHREAFAAAVRELAARVRSGLPDAARLLVIGTEELMYAPLMLACHLAQTRDGPVRFSSTTRSPVLPVDAAEYAIRTRLVFPAHDGEVTDAEHDVDSTSRFAYNVAPGQHGNRFDRIILVVDRAGDSPALRGADGLVSALRQVSDGVTVVVLPDMRPTLQAPTDHVAEADPVTSGVAW